MTSETSFSAPEQKLIADSRLRAVLPLVLTVIALTGLVFGFLVPHVQERFIALKKNSIEDLTQVAVGILDHYAVLEAAGRLSRFDAQQAAIAHLSRLHFHADNKGYFWINDQVPRLLMHPYRPDLVGQDVSNFSDSRGKQVFKAAVKAVQGPEGAGFIDYNWQAPGEENRDVAKLSHVRLFHPWGWIVGTGLYLQDVHEEISAMTARMMYGAVMLIVIIGLLVAYLTWNGLRIERGRRLVWNALVKRQEEQRAVLESSPHPVAVYDRQGCVIYINPAFSKTFGWSSEDVLGKPIDFVPEAEQEKTTAAIERAYADGYATLETRRLTQDGRLREVQLSAAAFRDHSGRIVGMVVNLMDITERKNAETALRESETKYRNLVENAGDAIFITQDGVIKFPNRRMKEVSGYDAQELGQLPFLEFIDPADRQMILDRHQRRLNGQSVSNPVVFRGVKRGGEMIWLELNAVTVEWEGRPAVLNFLRDITKRKQLENEIQQVQRLESLGTLAGGVAHDFNNLLMGIMGNTALMRLDIDADDPNYRRLEDIETHVRSGAALTRQLLGFARGGNFTMHPADLNLVVQKTVSLFGRTHKEIAIDSDYAADLWPVVMDSEQIGRVVLNLLVNAWQSMPGGGEITIATDNTVVGSADAELHGITAGRYAKVLVQDTGIGMDEATRLRIFEPFFTTRQMGRGAGLGLASAYGIVRNHGGMIAVASKKGVGTTFTVFLPATDKQPKPAEAPAPVDRQGGSETILIVDDEPMIREVGGEMLRRLGYRVICAEGGKEALEVFSRADSHIDLVILDMVMPGMSGQQVFERLRAADPKVRVLLASGYSEAEEAKEIMDQGCDGFIQKPFDLNEISRKLRLILDRR